jgi:hypothetical protein
MLPIQCDGQVNSMSQGRNDPERSKIHPGQRRGTGWCNGQRVWRVCVFALVIAVLMSSGCRHAYWLRHTGSDNPRLSQSEDWYEDWPRLRLADEDIEQVRARKFGPYDWPMMAALHNRSAWERPTQCRKSRDPFACLLGAMKHGEPAYAYRNRWGTDSVYGWGAAVSVAGELTLLMYDSSPCGDVLPSGRCGYLLAYRQCEQPAPLQPGKPQKLLCLNPLFGLGVPR